MLYLHNLSHHTTINIFKWQIDLKLKTLKTKISVVWWGYSETLIDGWVISLANPSVQWAGTSNAPTNCHSCRTQHPEEVSKFSALEKLQANHHFVDYQKGIWEGIAVPYYLICFNGRQQTWFLDVLGCGQTYRLLKTIIITTSMVDKPLFAWTNTLSRFSMIGAPTTISVLFWDGK